MSREWVIDAGGGDRFDRWDLTGYTASNTYRGRLYYSWISNALKLYKGPSLDASTLVATGTGVTVDRTITLASANSSGLSGSVHWKDAGDGDIAATDPASLFVTYAFSSDLVRLEKAVGTLLNIGGSTTFEDQLELAKADVDKVVRRRFGHLLEIDDAVDRPDFRGFRDLADELVDAQAYRALYWIYVHKAGAADPIDPFYSKALHWLEEWKREMRDLSLQIDLDADSKVDREVVSPFRFKRA